jgi:thiol-disulfide isomerase/thioredoxin
MERPLRRSAGHIVRILFLVFLLNSPVPASAGGGLPVPGQPVPDFSLPGLFNGRITALRDLKGKVVLLNIWASWCTACREEMEDLMAVQERYGPRGFALVAVSIDQVQSSAVAFMKRIEQRTKKKPEAILLYDKDKTVSQEYRQRSMPTSYLIDRKGNLVKTYLGSFSKSTLGSLQAEIEKELK